MIRPSIVWSLRMQYRLSPHTFLSTVTNERELLADFAVPLRKFAVIHSAYNNVSVDPLPVPAGKPAGRGAAERSCSSSATSRLIRLDFLVESLAETDAPSRGFRLIIAVDPRIVNHMAGIQEPSRERGQAITSSRP